jgi:hypothetical protein
LQYDAKRDEPESEDDEKEDDSRPRGGGGGGAQKGKDAPVVEASAAE